MKKRKPNLREEKKLWKKGIKKVIGLDEAGRGCLAGPVVAAAVMLQPPKSQTPNPKQIPNPNVQNSKRFGHLKFGYWDLFGNWKLEIGNSNLRDSKRLSPKQREKFYKIITQSPIVEWGIGKVSEKVIDKINILEATKLAMKRAIINLKNKFKKPPYYQSHGRNKTEVEFLILDGKIKLNLPIPQKAIVKADEKVFSCALASVIAKVRRDKIMRRYHQKYPQYGFAKHKGYPTKYHRKMLKKYGPSKIHRQSFSLL